MGLKIMQYNTILHDSVSRAVFEWSVFGTVLLSFLVSRQKSLLVPPFYSLGAEMFSVD